MNLEIADVLGHETLAMAKRYSLRVVEHKNSRATGIIPRLRSKSIQNGSARSQ